MSQPCDGIGLAGTGAVLDQIILRSTVYPDIGEELADDIQLMIAGKNQIFRTLHLAGLVIDFFFYFHEDKLTDKIEDGILSQNVLPHIRDTIFVRKSGIACARIHPFAVTRVERQEEGRFLSKASGHIDLLQIHRKVHKAACLEQEQSGLGIALGAVLVNGILIGLPGGIALQLKRNDGKAIQENHHIDALFVAGPDLLHDRENILAVFLCQFRVEGGGWLSVHQIQLSVGNFNTVFEHINQTAAGLGGFRIDKADNGVLQIILVDFSQIAHRIRLGVVQELEQHLPVNGKQAVKVSGLADHIAVVLGQAFQEKLLIIFFRQDIIHRVGTSFSHHLPVFRSINASNLIFPSKSAPYWPALV